MARKKAYKFNDTSVAGNFIRALGDHYSWCVNKDARLANCEQHDLNMSLDGRALATFTPIENRNYRQGQPRALPSIEELGTCETISDDVLVGLTLATIDEKQPLVTDGYFYFNGSTVVAPSRHRLFIGPCELPLLAERTQGAFAAVPRAAFALPMAQTLERKTQVSERGSLHDAVVPEVRIAFDDIEKTIIIDSSCGGGLRTNAIAPLRFEASDTWFDFNEALDLASVEPEAHARTTRAAIAKAKRMSITPDSNLSANERAKARDKRERAKYTLLVSTEHGLAVSGITENYAVREERNYGFDLAKGSEADKGFCHAVLGRSLDTAMLLSDTVTFGVGKSERGVSCLVFELPQEGRLILPAAKFKLEEVSDWYGVTIDGDTV